MTIVRQSRKNLNRALALEYRDTDPKIDPASKANIVLLIAGAENSVERKIYDEALEKVTLEWRKTFLITDLSILTQAEKNKWVGSNGRYCVVKVSGNKVVKGSTDDLQLARDGRPSGRPSGRKIKAAFRAGEQA